ncbi:MAG: 4-hydroxy-tetrahydrodipicolinate reductase [Bacteroidales bacterium]|jgi:4-hydroxy-tetrahydrodipicolinate reductase|nr:4-hydroxy-tetrahydrodipicolinate reductase [Bacteroidales bacterium]
MNIALIGYGKMGKAIEKIALERGHNISAIIDMNSSLKSIDDLHEKVDVAIEFTTPSSAGKNIYECLKKSIPVVSGTTGWNINIPEIKNLCKEYKTSMFYASNFSIGMNIFMEINKNLAVMMNKFDAYKVSIEETHHIHKLDKPSGTAITLAEDIIKKYSKYNNWQLSPVNDAGHLGISSFREGETIGDHKITWKSDIDKITIEHSAKNRDGFALGAILSAEYIRDKEGYFTMRDLLNL